MLLKTLSKRTLLVIILPGVVFFSALIFYFISKNSNNFVFGLNSLKYSKQFQCALASLTKNSAPFCEQGQIRPGLPVRLQIPKINVDTNLEYVGLTPDGMIDIPKSQDNAAWLELGPRPGENGSAVITGHYGWKSKEASAFDNLYKLHPGDKLYVKDDQGEIISFVVRESRRYNSQTVTTAVFDSNDEKSHLNLITCEGIWDEVSKDYPQRLVVFTDKE